MNAKKGRGACEHEKGGNIQKKQHAYTPKNKQTNKQTNKINKQATTTTSTNTYTPNAYTQKKQHVHAKKTNKQTK